MASRRYSIRTRIVLLLAVPLAALMALWAVAASASLGDALLLLKQQLETTYDSLRNKASTKEQERQLNQMRAYIQESRVVKPRW